MGGKLVSNAFMSWTDSYCAITWKIVLLAYIKRSHSRSVRSFLFFFSLFMPTRYTADVYYIPPFTVYSFLLHTILLACLLAGWLASPNAIYMCGRRARKCDEERTELNRKVAWIQSRKSQELVEHFSLNYINTHTYIIIHPTPLSCHVITFFVSFTSSFFILIFLGVCEFSPPPPRSRSHSSKMVMWMNNNNNNEMEWKNTATF